MKLKEELPVDHRLATVYRTGAAACGVLLMAFGTLGYAGLLGWFHTGGEVAGLSTNWLLSLISLVVGLVLLLAALIGGNLASTVNMSVGSLFILSGFVHLALLESTRNILDFGMSNVIFSFVTGLLILTFGLYGRVSGGLPHDNPYWRARNPEQAAQEDTLRAATTSGSAHAPALDGNAATPAHALRSRTHPSS